jgi:hypothetical protein
MMDYPINVNDARTYVIPIANIIGKRLNRISTLNSKLTTLVSKLYALPDESDKTEICNSISKTIFDIEILILKNIDDTQILEYSLAEFTMKPQLPSEIPQKFITSEPHEYFA